MGLLGGEEAWSEGAGRRTPCAGRAVILTAVQSLRLLVRRGATPYGVGAFVDGEPGVSLCATPGY